MARRADPERIFAAQRAGVRYGLLDTGMDEATANRWCDAWEIEAATRDLARDGHYWDAAFDWVIDERAARRWPAKRERPGDRMAYQGVEWPSRAGRDRLAARRGIASPGPEPRSRQPS